LSQIENQPQSKGWLVFSYLKNYIQLTNQYNLFSTILINEREIHPALSLLAIEIGTFSWPTNMFKKTKTNFHKIITSDPLRVV